MLFSAIGIAASDFFCPNLSTLAQTLRLSESMAGVTFLALGNGSPDLFSTFAAMRVGSGGLAFGELIGAAFFITSVVAGSMAIVNPFKVSRKSFLRDALFFSGAVAFSVGLLARGKVTTWETSCMIVYYIFYVVFVVVATWYWTKRSKKRRTESRARHHYRHPDEAIVEAEDDEASTMHEETRLIGDVRDLEIATVDEEAEMRQEYATLQHRMSFLRQTIDGTRTPVFHNHSNIRPSLFGALEVPTVQILSDDSFNHYQTNSHQHRRYRIVLIDVTLPFTLERLPVTNFIVISLTLSALCVQRLLSKRHGEFLTSGAILHLQGIILVAFIPKVPFRLWA